MGACSSFDLKQSLVGECLPLLGTLALPLPALTVFFTQRFIRFSAVWYSFLKII
jgi:hypothetical protein